MEAFGFKDQNNILVLSDNNSIIQLSKNSIFHERSKHINVR